MEVLNNLFSSGIAIIGVELSLAVVAMLLLLLGAFLRKNNISLVYNISCLALFVAILFLLYFDVSGTAFYGAFIMDSFARIIKIIILASAFFVLLLVFGVAKRQGFYVYEYPILLLLATLGMLLMVSANDMITLYLALELQSLSLYVLAALNRENVKATEAGLKYFVLGALSSGMLLYGISLIYGFTAQTGFVEIAQAMQNGLSLGLIFGLVFVLAGLAFKISAVPFHMWTPDVYEGAPSIVVAFFATAAKVAAMALLVRVLHGAFTFALFEWQQVVVFLSFASMLLGAFAAIGQTNIKRLVAYSSIGHVGFALLGLAAGSAFGVSSVVNYLIIYAVMTLGIFACILAMQTNKKITEEIDDLSGLFSTNPILACLLTILLFSLAGIPPLAGFWAKYFVFAAAIESGLYALAVAGVVSGVIAAFYYLRIIKVMWFDEAKETFLPMAMELKWVLALASFFALLYVLFADFIYDISFIAAASFF